MIRQQILLSVNVAAVMHALEHHQDVILVPANVLKLPTRLTKEMVLQKEAVQDLTKNVKRVVHV